MKDRMYPDVGIFTLPENLQVLQIHEVPDCSRQQLNHPPDSNRLRRVLFENFQLIMQLVAPTFEGSRKEGSRQ